MQSRSPRQSRSRSRRRSRRSQSIHGAASATGQQGCSAEEVAEHLGFTQRRFKKEQFMRARAEAHGIGTDPTPQPRRPARIEDTRFDKRRAHRWVCCDGCQHWYQGNEVGAHCHREHMQPTAGRKTAWERGEWDATWYCIGCYQEHFDCSRSEVLNWLGFSLRDIRKALYRND